MQQHIIISLADPGNSYDTVNLRYISSRIKALTDENRLQNDLIGVNRGMLNARTSAISIRLAELDRLAGTAPHQDDPDVWNAGMNLFS